MEDPTLAEFSSDVHSGYEADLPIVSTNWLCIKSIRTIDSLWKLEKAFLVISLISTLTIISINIYRLSTVDTTSSYFILEVIISVNILFYFYYVLIGVFFERWCELGNCIFSTFALFGYVLSTLNDESTGIVIFRSVVSGAQVLCTLVVGLIISTEYFTTDSLIFRTVGSDTELHESCKMMYRFFGNLKLDLQNSISLALWTLSPLNSPYLEEQILFSLMSVLSVSSSVWGYLMVRFEKKCLFVIYVVVWIIMPGFATYTIIKAAYPYFTAVRRYSGIRAHNDKVMRFMVVFCACIVEAVACWTARALTLYCSVQAFHNFGKGLKEKAFGSGQPSPPNTVQGNV